MEGDTPAEPSPTDADLVQGLRPSPLYEGLLADRKQRGTAALSFCAHDMHAPLVVFAGATAARNGLYDLYLFAVLFDQMADVDVPVQARVWVVLILSGWVWFGCGRVIHVDRAPFC
jgi:hypothetical protein